MDFYKIKKVTKIKCKNCLRKFIHSFDTFNNKRLSKKSIGELIRAVHFATPVNLIVLLCISPLYICNLVFAYILGVLFLFILFDGCFLTIIEQYYCEDNFTIIDPTLELLQLEVTNKNRFMISIPIAIIYISIALIIYDYRFIFQNI